MEQPRAQYVRTPEGHRKTVATDRVHVDVDRGVIQQITPGGVKVCMYVDQPGVYWTIKGEPVPEAVAKKAGFNVEALAKQRAFQVDQEKARGALTQALRQNSMILESKVGPYELYMVGDGLAVIFKDGSKLTETAAPYAAMKELFEDFTADLAGPMMLSLGKGEGDAGHAPPGRA